MTLQTSAFGNSTIGYNILKLYGIPSDGYWYWLGVGVLLLYAVFFNIMVTLALAYLKRMSQTFMCFVFCFSIMRPVWNVHTCKLQ